MLLPIASLSITFSAASVSRPDALPPEATATSDSSLIQLIQQRDQTAMRHLFECHSQLVYKVALGVLHDPAQAEDVLQEVFMQLWKKPITLDLGRGSLVALLVAMARNRSIDLIRQRKQTQSTDDFDVPSSFNLAADSERRLLLGRVREVASNLPQEQQSALELAFFEGLTHAEIAIQTGAPLGTVKWRIRNALQSLERILGHDCERKPRRGRVGAEFRLGSIPARHSRFHVPSAVSSVMLSGT